MTSARDVAWPRDPRVLRALAEAAADVAERELGYGEAPGRNNAGPHIDRYRVGAGLRGGGRGAWCAAFVSYAFATAAAELGVQLPFGTSAGAKALARAVARAGREVDLDTELPRRGDVVCWHRGPRVGPLSWRGHVGIVTGRGLDVAGHVELIWIDGNAGPAPSVVTRRRAPFERWTRRLYLLARLA